MALPYFTSTQGVELTKRVKDLENGGGSGGGSLPEIDLKLTIEIEPEEMAQGSSWTKTLSSDVVEEINKALSSYRVFAVILNLGVNMPGGTQYIEVPIIAKSYRIPGGTETMLAVRDFILSGLIDFELIGDELQINFTPLGM